MLKRTMHVFLILVVVCAMFMMVGCDPDEEETEAFKVAVIMLGSIQDADYNTLGYMALQDLAQETDVEVSYSERVAVPDVGRVINEYIDNGYDLIWLHGAQYNATALEIGAENPDVSFVAQVDVDDPNRPSNFWYLDRNYHTGFYVQGAAAALTTKTGHIGYIGGGELPFTRAQLNAMQQAIDDLGSDAKIHYLYVGDFNDPLETRRSAESLIARGVDVIVGSVNLGSFGLFTAAQEADSHVWITTICTDKSTHAPDNYLTTDLFDFSGTMADIVKRVADGEKGGYILLEYGEGKPRQTQFPLMNVPEEVNAKVKEIADKVAAGEIEVVQKLDEIYVK